MSYNYTQYGNPYARNYQQPNNYQPQYYPQQQVSQPQPQPQMVQAEIPLQYVGYATLKEAEAYILFPNARAIFIDKPNGAIYEKISNGDGQSFIAQYKRVEQERREMPLEATKDSKAIDYANLATKDDLGAFASLKQYNELRERVDSLQKMLNNPKQQQQAKQ